jgi:glycosyltransferase involved in cell wall biosynthesis
VSGPAYFDATFLAFGKDLRGIPQVIFQLVRLILGDPAFAGVRFISTPEVTRTWLGKWGIDPGRIEHVRPLPVLGRYERFHGLLSTFRYRRILQRAGLVIHPELRTVARTRVPQMVLYYDFIIFDRRATGERRKWIRYACYLYKNRVAARVPFKLAISEATRRKALELFPDIRPATVTARHLGIRMALADAPRNAPVTGAPLRFLYVGSYEARKNIPALLARLDKVAAGRPAILGLAGKMDAERRRELTEAARGLPPGVAVEFHGLVADADLPRMYRETDFYLFPSLSEGFGLPMVEAMSQGAVVCAFRNSSLPEIGGDAAILADDGDFAAWGRAISALAGDPAAYVETSRRSLARAAEFTEAMMFARYREAFLEALAASGAAA